MTTTITTRVASRPVTALGAQGQDRIRDLRLDFFRGLAMFIILVSHTPGNSFADWIPARWGFSDATEIFVFCSGMASAIAFGGVFARSGWLLGTARVLYRVWQVYWAHIGLFVATLAMCIWLTELDITGRNYWGLLNLWPMFVESDKWENSHVLLSFVTLGYVPNYFDILPMYMIVLLLMPLVIALARLHLALVGLWVIGLWLLAQRPLMEALGLGALHPAFPAEPWSDRPWFFNPFGWQLVFFTGFAFMRGWLPKPPVSRLLMGLAIAVVLLNVAVSSVAIREFGFDWASGWRAANAGLIDKTNFGVLRYVHFLSLAYICWVAAGDRGVRLLPRTDSGAARAWGGLLAVILKVGQQSLAVFVTSMFLARVMGFAMDVIGYDFLPTLVINLGGAALLVAVAYGAGWFKSQPWRQKRTLS